VCRFQLNYLTQDIKYHVLHEISTRQLWEILEKKYQTKSIESLLQLKMRFYRFQMKRRLSIDEHMNNYTKLLTDLVNMDVKIEKEDKALILLNSLPDEEYGTFTLTLINNRQTLNYSEVSAALVNYKIRSHDKLSSSESTSVDALVIRGRSFNRKGKDDRGRSKSRSGFRDLKKNQCAFCKVLGHWKIDCPRINDKNKKESKIEANLAQVVSTQASTSQADGSNSDSSVFYFSVTIYYWLLKRH